MNARIILFALAVVATSALVLAQDTRPTTAPTAAPAVETADQEKQPGTAGGFDRAASDVERQLQESIAELAALRERIAAEKIPLSRELGALEAELAAVRAEYQQKTRLLDGRALDLSNLKGEIASRQDEVGYVGNLLDDYAREFEARLHVSELDRFEDVIGTARLAPENADASEEARLRARVDLLDASLGRLEEAAGGVVFEGRAVGPDGIVHDGRFALVGPVALFRSSDGSVVGLAEQVLGSFEPRVIPFPGEEGGALASKAVAGEGGALPFDPTMGNAQKIAETEDTFVEHVKKGGPVMIPIFVMAGLALLVALYKWISLSSQRLPSKRRVNGLLEAIGRGDRAEAERRANDIKGPVGRMLGAGVEHLDEPRELVEEVMYEHVLTTRLKLERLLPFIAICAASAPLLGLLGTVTGIINTFKMITVFGSGDVKSLSGGISEALITTKFGLIVAIPSLLLHAFLSRKARGVIGRMETAAVAFINQISKTPYRAPDDGTRPAAGVLDQDAVRREVAEVLREMLGVRSAEELFEPERKPAPTGARA